MQVLHLTNQANAFVYNTGTATNPWSSRLQADESFISSYDYMVFDILFSGALTNPITFWMDLAAGDVNVFTLQPDGTVSKTDKLYIFNVDKELVTGSLDPNVTYTFIIQLAHGDPEGRYAFGLGQDMVLYLRNPHVAKASYLEPLYDLVAPEVE